jgi:hypothetical protein
MHVISWRERDLDLEFLLLLICFTQSSRETDIFYTNSDSGFDERIDNIQEYHLWLDFADINPGLFINNRKGCDITDTSDLYDDGPPEIELKPQQLVPLEELTVEFCESNQVNRIRLRR